MGARLDSRKTCGVVKLLCVLLFHPFMKWFVLKGLGLWIFGRQQGRGVVGTSGLKGILMIGSWK